MQMRFLASGQIFSLHKELNFTAMQCWLFRENIEIVNIAKDTVFISQHHVKTLLVLECIKYYGFPRCLAAPNSLQDQALRKKLWSHVSLVSALFPLLVLSLPFFKKHLHPLQCQRLHEATLQKLGVPLVSKNKKHAQLWSEISEVVLILINYWSYNQSLVKNLSFH